MERVKWEKPRAEVQAFVADDYVAACYSLICQYDSGKLSKRQNDGNPNKIGDMHSDGETREIFNTVIADNPPSIELNAYTNAGGGWTRVFYWQSDDGKYHASTGYVRDKANIS